MVTKIDKIFQRTIELVGRGEITWIPGRNENEFRADYDAASLVIGKANGAEAYFNVSKGKDVLETYTSPKPGDSKVVTHLYESVRAQALNTEDTLDALLKELG